MIKIGLGYDIHRLVDGRKLILGGVEIRSPKGLLGHSDADVLLHAICDALLGAVGAPDIGHQFPDTDKKYKDISSLELLKKVKMIVAGKSYNVDHIDSVVLLESPKIAAYRQRMRARIAGALKIKKEQISIKATTQEGVGLIGRGEAAAALAVCLIQKRRSK